MVFSMSQIFSTFFAALNFLSQIINTFNVGVFLWSGKSASKLVLVISLMDLILPNVSAVQTAFEANTFSACKAVASSVNLLATSYSCKLMTGKRLIVETSKNNGDILVLSKRKPNKREQIMVRRRTKANYSKVQITKNRLSRKLLFLK